MTERSRLRHTPHAVQRQIRGLPTPEANPEFRSALRAAFVSRSIPEPRVAPLLRLVLGSTPRGLVYASATAAALIAVMWLNTGPAWKLRDVSGTGSIRVDGRTVVLGSTAEIARAMRPGARMELPEGSQLDLELPGIAIVQVVGGSRVVLPASPGRWYARSVRGSLESGELRITTNPRFEGARLAIETPEARAVVTGTTFAVLRLPDASCVCVLEGAVSMSSPNAVADTVHAGFRRVVYRDGRPPVVEPILPMETMKLEMLRAQAPGGTPR